ncbi:MAG: hypothetical protein A2Y38_14480 [Spirochaetes bacterium GWB1_59_5]|nr:MAG: hypothetical protein A2Y38_14480 [Spirochaetes bacterium GWB1_59_5]
MTQRTDIKDYLAAHGLRLGVRDGERVLEEESPREPGGWRLVARRVRTWAVALQIAVTLGLCPEPKAIPVVSDTNFSGAELAIPGHAKDIVKLTQYQLAAINDPARIVILKWCRQAGKDFTAALMAVLNGMETGQNWYIVSLTQRQALATAKKAQQHARAIEHVLPPITEGEWGYQVDGKAFTVTSYGVRLKNGAEIVALPGKDPDALAGLTGNVIFTEMALFPGGGVDHWRVVFPLASRGFRIWAISTPRGHDTKFAELCRNPQGKYSVHVVDIHAAIAGGLELTDETGKPITAEDLRQLYNDEQGWDREYLCHEGDDHEALIDWKYINDCTSAYEIATVNIKGGPATTRTEYTEQCDEQQTRFFSELRAKMTGRPVVGWDIAVTGDLSVIVYGEVLGDVVWLRGLIVMAGVDDFDYQEELVCRAMETGAAGVGDASGLGREACQRVEKRFPVRFAGLVLSTVSKSELFTQFRDCAQAARLRIPQGNDLIRYDIHALAKKGVGVAQRLQILTLRNSTFPRSHADVATALAMMVDAAQDEAGPTTWQAVGADPAAMLRAVHPAVQQFSPEALAQRAQGAGIMV